MKTHIKLTGLAINPKGLEAARYPVLVPVANTVFLVVQNHHTGPMTKAYTSLSITDDTMDRPILYVAETLDEIEALLDAAAKP